MTPDEQAKLDRQRRIARSPEVRVEEREPLDGQGSLKFGRPEEVQTKGDDKSKTKERKAR